MKHALNIGIRRLNLMLSLVQPSILQTLLHVIIDVIAHILPMPFCFHYDLRQTPRIFRQFFRTY